MRGWVRLLLVVLLVLLLLVALRPRPSPGEPAWSVQLHLHGPFSEGQGSIDSHGYEASDVGCDVLWWSEHDFRLLGFEHVSRFGFEDWSEPIDRGEPWRTRLKKGLDEQKGIQLLENTAAGTASFVSAPVHEGERSLRLETRGSKGTFDALTLSLLDGRALLRRSLATGVTLRLALFVEELGPDARAVVEVALSEHAPRDGVGLVPYALRYVIAPGGGAPSRGGPVYTVPVDCVAGQWNEIELPLSADAVRGFPSFPGEDDILYTIALGVKARRGKRAAAVFDDLRVEQRLQGPVVFRRQRELLDEVGRLWPGLVQLQGLELSYGSRHLNLFCADTPLPDYDAIRLRTPPSREDPELLDMGAFRAEITREAVDETHRRGGLVSYNHPFGVDYEGAESIRDRDLLLARLLQLRAEGADLLEVGYRDRGGATLADHLWLWDQAGLAGLRLVGIGVSDSHGGERDRWRGRPNNMVTWIYAARPESASLIEGLRAGRAFFGDLELFDGTLDLATDRGHRMGRVVLTDREEVELELAVEGLARAAELVVVESGREAARMELATGRTRRTHRHRLGSEPAFVRFELHTTEGAFALSNPIHFLRSLPPDGLPAAVAAVDRDGIVSREWSGLALLGWEAIPARTGARRIECRVRATGGRAVLDLAGFGPLAEVVFSGLAGRQELDGARLLLDDLEGEGVITLVSTAP